jgi:hypothetical protein
MTTIPAPAGSGDHLRSAAYGERLARSPAVGVGAIWVFSALAAVMAPDMVTGSAHEHLPIVAATVWVWTLSATGFVLLASTSASSTSLGLVPALVWLAVFVVAVAAPVMETGTDPTTIPLAGLVAPPVGAVATGFLAVHAAASGRRRG